MTEKKSKWLGGKPIGCIGDHSKNNYYQVSFSSNLNIKSKTFSVSSEGSILKAKENAEKWRQKISDQNNLTKNKYRYIIEENGDLYIEVKLQDELIMKCDYDHLHIVNERIWTGNKAKNKYTYYAKSRSSKKRDQNYCLFHRRAFPEFKEVDHINRNGLDNRSRNVREGGGRINATNRSKPKNNTSGYKGVRKENGPKARWKATWIDKKTGKRRTKSFSIKKYGEEEAKRCAIACRNEHAPKAEEL